MGCLFRARTSLKRSEPRARTHARAREHTHTHSAGDGKHPSLWPVQIIVRPDTGNTKGVCALFLRKTGRQFRPFRLRLPWMPWMALATIRNAGAGGGKVWNGAEGRGSAAPFLASSPPPSPPHTPRAPTAPSPDVLGVGGKAKRPILQQSSTSVVRPAGIVGRLAYLLPNYGARVRYGSRTAVNRGKRGARPSRP